MLFRSDRVFEVVTLPGHERDEHVLAERQLTHVAGGSVREHVARAHDFARTHHGEAGWDAFFFLNESLYRLRSAYQVADWVLWPLCSKSDEVDLMEARYRLCQGGWSPGWTGERLFIFDRREEFGLR